MTELIQEIGEKARRADEDRVIHTFTVPKSLQKYGITTIGFVELNVDEQMMASKSAAGDVFKAGTELVVHSLRMVDGKRVGVGDCSSDQALRRMHPKVRDLAASAYRYLHQAEANDARDFLASHTQEA